MSYEISPEEAMRRAKLQIERTRRHNEKVKEKYDRFQGVFPKGTKDRITALGIESINSFVSNAVIEKLEQLEKK